MHLTLQRRHYQKQPVISGRRSKSCASCNAAADKSLNLTEIGSSSKRSAAQMKSIPGTYALILRSSRKSRISVGRAGEIEFRRGFYIYIGSAFGPGGVRARVNRHCRRTKKNHWHIDYIREFLALEGAIVSYDLDRLEHNWAQALCTSGRLLAVPGIGCTDCGCTTHLFFSSCQPGFGFYCDHLAGDLEEWNYGNSA